MGNSKKSNGNSTVRRTLLPAFTLVELLVVIAIISVLAAILMPSLNRAKSLARDVACLAGHCNWTIAYARYAMENNGWIPGARTTSDGAWPGFYKAGEIVGSSDFKASSGPLLLRTSGYMEDTGSFFCPKWPYSVVNGNECNKGTLDALEKTSNYIYTSIVAREGCGGIGSEYNGGTARNIGGMWYFRFNKVGCARGGASRGGGWDQYTPETPRGAISSCKFFPAPPLCTAHPNGPIDEAEVGVDGWNVGYNDGSAQFVPAPPHAWLIPGSCYHNYLFWESIFDQAI